MHCVRDCAAVCPITRPMNSMRCSTAARPSTSDTPRLFECIRHRKAREAPCRNACPIEQRAMGYVALIRERGLPKHTARSRKTTLSPPSAGRVCNHKCEQACSRGDNGHEAVNIMHLKRFVTDWAFAHPEEVQKAYAAGLQNRPTPPDWARKWPLSAPAGRHDGGERPDCQKLRGDGV